MARIRCRYGKLPVGLVRTVFTCFGSYTRLRVEPGLEEEFSPMNILKIAEVPPAVVSLTTTVLEAVQVMVSKRVGAVAVVQEDRLAGIFTERDVMRRVVLASRDPTTTTMRDVMTPSVESASVDKTPGEALAAMIERHFRHLPIADSDGRVLGMLSVRNLLQSHVEDLTQQLDSMENYLTADGPGG